MLVLTRKENERICIGDDIVITVVRLGGDKVRLGIEAPAEQVILRSELKEREKMSSHSPTIRFDIPCVKCS
jgi:carbon storage regulator